MSNHHINPPERRCENPDCNVVKLVSMVPKRKTTQFQVDGSSAKLMDIKNRGGDSTTKAIYRIAPNAHVHVVNYVVVDTDEAYLCKISLVAPTSATLFPTVNVLPMQSSASSLTNVSTTPVTSGTVMHPNLKITAAASAESVPTLTGIALSSVITPAISTATVSPYITPVPLASLQNAAPSSRSKEAVQPIVAMPLSGPLSWVTVTTLAEAQAKNQQQRQIAIQRHAKRSRTISSKIVP
uniref:Uncharacterized protein n=1 Tax=Glossina morsitans morsitans TaxID=37546 RepID=A0A1B0G7W6_GLOMM